MLLSDGKGVGGSGRLTDPVIERMHTAYGYAIRKNKGDPEASARSQLITWQNHGQLKVCIHQHSSFVNGKL